jgi:hypothetical protein
MQHVKNFIRLMEYIHIKHQRKFGLTLMDSYAHKIYSEHIGKNDVMEILKDEMKHNPDLIRHLVVCDTDICP